MKKTIVALSLITAMIVSCISTVYAFPREKHDDYLQSMLFIEGQPDSNQEAVKLLEEASFLAIDQFNGTGQKELTDLSKAVRGVPEDILAINFKANDITHRYYTHKGWDFDYQLSLNEDPAHSLTRKRILLLTVNDIFDFGLFSGSWFGHDMFDKKCNSFCALIYYAHVIGDHINDKTYKNNPQAPLYRPNDEKNPGIIPEMIKHCEILFADNQSGERVYEDFIRELKSQFERIKPLVNSKGRIDTQEEFDVYHKCAEDLMDLLINNVPILLKGEDFFLKVFYPDRGID